MLSWQLLVELAYPGQLSFLDSVSASYAMSLCWEIFDVSTYRRSTQQTQGRADHQTKQRVNSEGNAGWRKTTVMSGSSHATLAANSESFAEANVGDSLDTESIGKLGSGISADPNDNQV